MAVPANQRRQIALELVDNVTALKVAIDAVDTVVSAWTLDDADNTLPTDLVIKAQLAAYDAIAKPSMSLADALAAIRAAA